MKTTAKAEITAVNARFLEDIVFEGRNQNYGAYSLRKNYNNHLLLSLLVVLGIAIVIVSLAFLHSIFNPAAVIDKPLAPTDGARIIDFTPFTPELSDPPPQKALGPVINNTKEDGVPIVVVETEVDDKPMLTVDERKEQTGSHEIPQAVTTITPMPIMPEPEDQNKTYTVTQVTTQALFAGGSVENFTKWLSKHINYPEDAIKNDVNGKVIVQFTVDKSGNITDIKILRGIHPVIDQAAIRALKASPKWTAATIQGKPVKVSYFLPIAFRILK